MREVMTAATAPRPVQQRLFRAAIESRIRETIHTQWEHDWQTSPHGRAVYELTPAPTKQVSKMRRGLHRTLSTIIIQMRTGKIGLRHHLSTRGVARTRWELPLWEGHPNNITHTPGLPHLQGSSRTVFGETGWRTRGRGKPEDHSEQA